MDRNNDTYAIGQNQSGTKLMVMKNVVFLIAVFSLIFIQCGRGLNPVTKIEMDLSSFGVESDYFPTIHASINLTTGESICKKMYYSPKHRDSTYSLSSAEIKLIRKLVEYPNLNTLKNNYSVEIPDQGTSPIKFYISRNTKSFMIKDYGLTGPYPLQELYKIVYKF